MAIRSGGVALVQKKELCLASFIHMCNYFAVLHSGENLNDGWYLDI